MGKSSINGEIALSRRRFCHFLATAAVACALPACTQFRPAPFTTGKTVNPPTGCRDLRRRNPRGDC